MCSVDVSLSDCQRALRTNAAIINTISIIRTKNLNNHKLFMNIYAVFLAQIMLQTYWIPNHLYNVCTQHIISFNKLYLRRITRNLVGKYKRNRKPICNHITSASEKYQKIFHRNNKNSVQFCCLQNCVVHNYLLFFLVPLNVAVVHLLW